MASMRRMGSEDARANFPALVKAAEKGRPTVIMRYARPVAVLMAIDALGKAGGHPSKAGRNKSTAKRRRR